MTPTLHIAFPIQDGPTGGGNQFLRALRDALIARGVYEADVDRADVVLFNSFQNIPAVLKTRRRNPGRPFIHRVDGPTRLYNRPDDKRDGLAIDANGWLADATVFQTEWCRSANHSLGWPMGEIETVIGNAADRSIFTPRSDRVPEQPLKVIATSWSNNPNKGFDTYQYLDEVLDPARVALTFVGNSPVTFRNVRHLAPMSSPELAAELARHDVFLTASRSDPCSNSLIEALTCGLPAVARRDGGHPELLGEGGLLFQESEEIPGLLEQIAADYPAFQAAIRLPTIDEIAGKYVDLAARLSGDLRAGSLRPRRPGYLAAAQIAWRFRGI